MKISIIIPTFNGKELLQQNILHLESELTNIVTEIIIVDNASTDGTADLFANTSDFIKYHRLPRNYGFTKAVNTGATEAIGELLLILNNDCQITNRAVLKLVEFLEGKKLVATQPIVANLNGAIENVGYMVDLKKGKAKTVTSIYELSHQSPEQIWSEGKVYGLSAACLLIQKSVFIKMGKLDESFHSYLEDVDLFIRLAKKGYHFAPCISSTVIHAHMSTSSKMEGYKEWHDFKNWIKIIIKNYPRGFILANFPELLVERMRNLNGYLKKVFYP